MTQIRVAGAMPAVPHTKDEPCHTALPAAGHGKKGWEPLLYNYHQCRMCGGESSPLSNSVISRWTATEIATFCIGTTIIAGVLSRGTLIHIMACTGELVIGKSRWTCTLVAPECVVARCRAASIRVGTLIFI